MKKNGRNTTLTRFGEEFLSCAEHTLSTLDEGITTLHRNARGEGLIAQGFGIAVVPYMDILQKLNVNILQIRSPNYERAFFMVHNDCVYIPPVVQKFRQFLLDDGMMLTEEPA